MEKTGNRYWDTLHSERPLWYACVWKACAALASRLREDTGRNLPPGMQENDPSSVAMWVRSRIFSLVEEQKTEIDTWVLLLLALEDPALAETSPSSFDALRQHMNAAYLLREQFAHNLAGDLARFWEASRGVPVMNSLPSPAPLPERNTLPPHLHGPGSVSLTMGAKSANHALGIWQAQVRQEWGIPPDTDELLAKAVKFLEDTLPAKNLPPPDQYAARGAIPLPLEDLYWSQRVEKACRALASRLDQAVEEFGEPPGEDEAMCMVKECADDATYSDCDTRALLLLALEDHGFVECEPDNYEVLQADHRDGEITLTAEYLISENVYLALLDELEAYLGFH